MNFVPLNYNISFMNRFLCIVRVVLLFVTITISSVNVNARTIKGVILSAIDSTTIVGA